jgi:hypothetical protein
MVPLKEMLVTARRHFKQVETSNFEALLKQFAQYKAKLAELGIGDKEMEKHKARIA